MKFCPVCEQSFEGALRFCPSDGGPLVDAAEPHRGQVLLGQFELREVIGRGAMGTVYRAWQAGMERDVAVKILHEHLVGDPDSVRRFMREARAVARLSHPSIAVMYALGELEGGVPFMAMEYVAGTPLDSVLRDEPMPADRSCDIAAQVAAALAEAHAVGIVHRDLKPANLILRDRGGRRDSVTILDFGIAKILSSDARIRDSHLTREGAIFGTPSYLSPEQASGNTVDGRADLYSLGVILFRMLTGRLPFDGAALQVLVEHVSKQPPRVRDIVPHIDPALDELVWRLMQKKPGDRFATAAELMQALDALGGSGPQQRPATGQPKLDRTVVASRSQLALGAAAAGAQAEPSFVSQFARAPAGQGTDENEDGAATALEAASARGGEGSDANPPDAADSLTIPVRRRWLGWLSAALAFSVIAAGVGVGVYALRRSAVPAAVPAAVAPVRRPEPPRPPPPPGGRRALLVSDAGYALRIEMPARLVVDVEYEVVFDVWDPQGEPMAAPEVIATIEEPTGIERGLAAKPTGRPGRFRFTRRFGNEGQHYLHILPPAGATNLKIPFRVDGVAGADDAATPGATAPDEEIPKKKQAQDDARGADPAPRKKGGRGAANGARGRGSRSEPSPTPATRGPNPARAPGSAATATEPPSSARAADATPTSDSASAGADRASDSDTDSASAAETGAGSASDSDSDTGADSDSDSASDAATDSASDADTGSGSDSASDSDPGSDSPAGPPGDERADKDSDAPTDPAAPSVPPADVLE